MLRRENYDSAARGHETRPEKRRDCARQLPDSVQTASAADTEALGAQFAASLRRGDVVLVAGELGAGKTTFVRGACRALGVMVPVTSPTFTIGQRYPAPVPVSHIDLYRTDGLAHEEPDLLADYLGPDAIVFVEWPPAAPWDLAEVGGAARRVRIAHAGGDRRLVEID
ncbi:MAG: tRNA (adenosine(37)-N6)-threonylcarbamoyltransferase complex ATPase subunit type 1 TsaE [Solirubrobacterales bacterium]|nr:tRNA (adenosine(37)-N6)-threonylcarbamoyltransferase complex ATPase subunit type 1 TsaE [Solirubrobacterales bacterium]